MVLADAVFREQGVFNCERAVDLFSVPGLHGWGSAKANPVALQAAAAAYLTRALDSTASDTSGEELAQQLRSLRSDLEELKTRFHEHLAACGSHDEATLPDGDPAMAWMEQHPEEVAKHRGKRVAVHPRLGVVAVGSDYLEVATEVRRLGLAEQILIASVPDF